MPFRAPLGTAPRDSRTDLTQSRSLFRFVARCARSGRRDSRGASCNDVRLFSLGFKLAYQRNTSRNQNHAGVPCFSVSPSTMARRHRRDLEDDEDDAVTPEDICKEVGLEGVV